MAGFTSRHSLFFILKAMNDVTLSVFVDESGNFKLPDRESRFYIIGMVIHDQS